MPQYRAITESFDLYPTVATPGYGMFSTWVNNGNDGELVPGRFGGQAYRDTGVGTTGHFRVIPATTQAVQGWAFYVRGGLASANGQRIITFTTDGTLRAWARVEAGGFLSVGTGNTELARSAAPLIINEAWHYVELAVNFAVEGEIRCYLNDVEVAALHVEGVNLGAGTVNRVQMHRTTNGSPQFDYDDMYVEVDGFARVGEGRIFTLRTDADAHTDFAPSVGADNFANVDDVPANDATYNSSNVLDAYDLFGVEAMTANPSLIFGVQLTTLAQKDEASARAIRGLLISGAAPTEETDDIILALNSSIFGGKFFALDPNTGARFTRPAVENLNIGYKVSV